MCSKIQLPCSICSKLDYCFMDNTGKLNFDIKKAKRAKI